MKNPVLLLFSLLLPAVYTFAQSTQMVQFNGLEGKKGQLYIGWYRHEEDFMHPDKAVFKKIIPVTGLPTVEVAFDSIPDGTYAITVFLDKNNNGVLDKNAFGIPKEEYGFSNNARPLTRPANFNEAKFEVKGKGAPWPITVK
ncbi:MAG: DUF2141 domain-containing protein [Flavihumibacter sp.]